MAVECGSVELSAPAAVAAIDESGNDSEAPMASNRRSPRETRRIGLMALALLEGKGRNVAQTSVAIGTNVPLREQTPRTPLRPPLAEDARAPETDHKPVRWRLIQSDKGKKCLA